MEIQYSWASTTSSRGGFLHGGGFLLRETAPAPHFCMDLAPTECVWERRGGKEVVAGLTGVFRKWEIILAVCFCGGSGNCMHSASHSLALLSHSCFPRKNPSHAKADSNNWCVFVWQSGWEVGGTGITFRGQFGRVQSGRAQTANTVYLWFVSVFV